MSRFLERRSAVVTGAGQGIGAAVALALSGAGARVVLAGRTVSKLEDVAGRIAATGGEAHAVEADVADPGQVEALARVAAERVGQVAILVNNAGMGYSAPLKRTSLEDWNTVMGVNATGTFLCTKEFLPAMVASGWGRVINVSSVAGLSGAAYITAYSASKHAVMGLTRCLAAEVASSGVTVNAVCPGFVATPMTDASVANIVSVTGKSESEARGAITATSPQGRLIEPEEVAQAVLFLTRDEARGINGQAVVIDGGGLLS